MSEIRINSLVFDRGIESITHAHQQTASTLPERSDASPPDVGVRGQLDLLLQKPSMDDRLDEGLRPSVEHRGMLLPGRFQDALGGAIQHLRQVVQNDTGASDPSRVLNRAARLLGEELNLRELVQMYRSALYQG